MPNPVLMNLLFVGVALVAGMLMPFQAPSNAALGRALGHPFWASAVSLLVSFLLVLVMLLVLRAPAPAVTQTFHLPPWVWIGGFVGVFYVSASLILAPHLGATGLMVCLIAGQILASLVIDHFGLVGLPRRPASAARLVGIVVMLVGVAIVLATSSSAPVAAGK
ncbi:DMT family transporter [Halomonas sp. Bachu 37]|uniref:DMT family transporter n=1 Tax=Halomonas kashgarensis TaxID=3084920 RepID=UPI003217D386